MIKFFDIQRADKKLFNKNIKAIKKIIKKTNFINGDEVKIFENNFSKFCNVKYSVGCNSGSDAIFMALKALNLKKNSEVILPAQTYASTIFAVIRANLKPVLADIQSDNPTICPKSLEKKISLSINDLKLALLEIWLALVFTLEKILVLMAMVEWLQPTIINFTIHC